MKRKIEWYKEVLSLEPGSKVFFPLARLYAESGQVEEALAVLRQGVERHPEHLEARFMLVELLESASMGEEAGREASGLGELLARYPAFWRHWADSLAAASPDAALGLRVFSLQLKGEPLNWSQLLERGLRTYAAETAASSAGPAPASETVREPSVHLAAEDASCPPPSPTFDVPAKFDEFLAEVGVDASAPPPAGEPVEAAGQAAIETLVGGQTHGSQAVASAQPEEKAQPESLAEPVREDDEAFVSMLEREGQAAEPVPASITALDETDGFVDEPEADAKTSDEASLRTATMAEILAGQGDVQAALDIYRELRAQAESPEQARRAMARMEELEELLGQASLDAEEPIAKSEVAEIQRGRSKKKLMGALGVLADRLESRSGSDR